MAQLVHVQVGPKVCGRAARHLVLIVVVVVMMVLDADSWVGEAAVNRCCGRRSRSVSGVPFGAALLEHGVLVVLIVQRRLSFAVGGTAAATSHTSGSTASTAAAAAATSERHSVVVDGIAAAKEGGRRGHVSGLLVRGRQVIPVARIGIQVGALSVGQRIVVGDHI